MASENNRFQRDLLESVGQMRAGDAARRTVVDTSTDNVAVTLHLPAAVVELWKATGPGWQARMVDVLSEAIRG